MAREITLWLAMDADGTASLHQQNPHWSVVGGMWDSVQSTPYIFQHYISVKSAFGLELQCGEKIKLGPMPIGRRQKARRK